VPGYTILVLDTNILLSSLNMVTSLVESLRWTIVIPLPAIMELDGLSSNPTALGEAAKAAIEFVASHVHSHFDTLKVQTSRLVSVPNRLTLMTPTHGSGAWMI